MTAVTAAFAMPAILDERVTGRSCKVVRDRRGCYRRHRPDRYLIIRSLGNSSRHIPHAYTGLACLLVAGCTAAVLVAVFKQNTARLIAVAAFCAIVATIALAPDKNSTTGAFNPSGTTAQLEGYQAGYDITQLVAKYDRPSARSPRAAILLDENANGLLVPSLRLRAARDSAAHVVRAGHAA